MSAVFTISTSSCPTPTVSMMMKSLPKASSILIVSAVAFESPPKVPRVAMDRTKTPSSLVMSCMRSRSPSNAPPVKGLVGSTAMIPTVYSFFRSSLVILSVSVLFPDPGGPVIPTI